MARTNTPRYKHDESGDGEPRTPEYSACAGLKRRATHKPRWYEHVTMDPRWERYENFLADMGRKPSREYTLDRRDGRKGYTKDNCRWATRKEQSRNLSHCHWLTHNGETCCIGEWAERLGCSAPCIAWRITNGWSIADAVTTKSQRHA